MSAVPLLAGLGAVTSLASSLSIVFLPVFTPSSQNLTPSPPPQLPLLSLTVGRREGEGVVCQLPPHWSSPPSPPSPPTLPPPPSLLGGARVETPSSPLTHPNSASETVSKSESAIRHIPCLRCSFAHSSSASEIPSNQMEALEKKRRNSGFLSYSLRTSLFVLLDPSFRAVTTNNCTIPPTIHPLQTRRFNFFDSQTRPLGKRLTCGWLSKKPAGKLTPQLDNLGQQPAGQ